MCVVVCTDAHIRAQPFALRGVLRSLCPALKAPGLLFLKGKVAL